MNCVHTSSRATTCTPAAAAASAATADQADTGRVPAADPATTESVSERVHAAYDKATGGADAPLSRNAAAAAAAAAHVRNRCSDVKKGE
jgi:hypothetical protein